MIQICLNMQIKLFESSIIVDTVKNTPLGILLSPNTKIYMLFMLSGIPKVISKLSKEVSGFPKAAKNLFLGVSGFLEVGVFFDFSNLRITF